jgi:hypothetical protein
VRESNGDIICADDPALIDAHVALWNARADLESKASAALAIAQGAGPSNVVSHLTNCVVPVVDRLLAVEHDADTHAHVRVERAGTILATMVVRTIDEVDGVVAPIEDAWVRLLQRLSFVALPPALELIWRDALERAYRAFAAAQQQAGQSRVDYAAATARANTLPGISA